ncbi:MAG: cytochrome c3 family protein [Candidatus Lindowbacteria bacterium]|nr:cytochrome c3 family protein [Candidatus Lindowbacteria bacterium]
MNKTCLRPQPLSLILLATCLFLMFSTPARAQESSCVTCHKEADDERLTPPVNEWLQSVHRDAGVGCHTCHGGNPAIEGMEAMTTKDYVGVPSVKQIPNLCGSCHSDPDKMRKYNLRVDEYDLFKRSGHGRALFEKGDTKVATCVSCHGAHKILSKKDPGSPVYFKNMAATCGKCHSDAEYMKGYGLPTDQAAQYSRSYHAQIIRGEIPDKNPALAPTCASCHTHSPLLPGAVEVPEICGRCHSVTAKYFKDSPHYVALTEVGLPRCVDCHGNHEILYPGIEIFSADQHRSCGSCHDPSSSEYQAGQQIKSLLEDATKQVSLMEKELADIEHSGRNLDDLKTLTEEARTNLTEVLPITHTLAIERIKEKTDLVIANAAKLVQNTSEFKAELKARKRNLAIILAVIFVNIGFLYLKRRSLDH